MGGQKGNPYSVQIIKINQKKGRLPQQNSQKMQGSRKVSQPKVQKLSNQKEGKHQGGLEEGRAAQPQHRKLPSEQAVDPRVLGQQGEKWLKNGRIEATGPEIHTFIEAGVEGVHYC